MALNYSSDNESKNNVNFPENDWPEWLEMPSDEDIKTLAEMSERNTSSAFFNN